LQTTRLFMGNLDEGIDSIGGNKKTARHVL
jgi:hypothetical protein